MKKILKILLVVVGVILIGAVVVFSSYSKLNTQELQPNEVVLKGNDNKKALVLYQKSKHSTATNITMALAQELNRNGYTVVINHPSPKLTYKTEDFEVLAFGSAVYMGSVSKPLQEYMGKASLKGKNVLVYAVGSATEVTTEVDMLKEKSVGADIIDGIKVKKGEEDKMRAFVKKFLVIK